MSKKEIIREYKKWATSHTSSWETDNLIGDILGWPTDYIGEWKKEQDKLASQPQESQQECKCTKKWDKNLGWLNIWSSDCTIHCHQPKEQEWENEWKLKFSEVVARMVRLQIYPFIQGLINERIPEQHIPQLFESQELEDFIRQLLSHQQEEYIRRVEGMKEKNLPEPSSNLESNIKGLQMATYNRAISDVLHILKGESR